MVEQKEGMASQGCGPDHSGSRDDAGLVAAAPLTGILPDVLDGHWTTAEGREMAERYAAQPRSAIGFPDHTDFSLANAVYLADRNSLDLTVMQTAAKDRIRWLSANLAMAREYVETANRDIARVYTENQTLIAKMEELRLIRQMAAAAVKWDEENLAAIPDGRALEPSFSVGRYWRDRVAISRSWQAFCADPINHPGRKNLTPDGAERVHTGPLSAARAEPKQNGGAS